MPNRILRDWTDSESIDQLSIHAERFFTRLIMKVDDYGRYTANVKMLKSSLFPLKTDVRETDIALWLTECKQCGLIALYNIAMRDYLQIENFKQTLRQKKEKYPAPIDCIADDKQMRSGRIPETKRNETETETEGEKKFFMEEKFLVPEMMKEWKKVFKNYPEKKENDFPALMKIAEFISDKEKIDCDIGIMPSFRQLAQCVSQDDFFKNYSLLQVNKHIQNIVQKIQNGSSKAKAKSNNIGLREQVNQAFAKRNS